MEKTFSILIPDLHIYGPDAIYVFGPEDRIILEGNIIQFETIIFSDETGTLVYEVRNNSREGVDIDPKYWFIYNS